MEGNEIQIPQTKQSTRKELIRQTEDTFPFSPLIAWKSFEIGSEIGRKKG